MIPGPKSKLLARRLAQSECAEVTHLGREFPVFWTKARGCQVWDADGNRYVDMTAAFAVANLGHCHPALVRSVGRQAGRLMHGMGDVHPPAIKVKFLSALRSYLPRPLGHAILSQNGSDAVESAIKTALMARRNRPGIVAFTGSYHGLSFGALSVTGQRYFRNPFLSRLSKNTLFVDYPNCYRCPLKLTYPACQLACLTEARKRIQKAGGGRRFCAVIVEPIQGRGGEVVPPPGWLKELSRICRRDGLLLIADEIYTGFGRTGRRLACDHEGVVPDILCLGKGLTGGFPMSVCVGRPAVMGRWGRSKGEALHTSTHLGNPLGCAVGLTALSIYNRLRPERRAAGLGAYLLRRLRASLGGLASVGDIRGKGLMVGIDLVKDIVTRVPDSAAAQRVVRGSLKRGLIILSGGEGGNVLSLSPPLVITRREIDFCVDVLEDVLNTLEKNHGRI